VCVCVCVCSARHLSPFTLHISGVIYALIVFCTANLLPAAESRTWRNSIWFKKMDKNTY